MFLKLLLIFGVFSPILGADDFKIVAEPLRDLLPGFKRDIVIEMEPVLGSVLTNPGVVALTGDARRNEIIRLLREKSRLSQLPVMNALASLGLSQRATSYWVANRIVVKQVDIGAITALSRIPGSSGILAIREPIRVKIYPSIETATEVQVESFADSTGENQYGVVKIGAPEAWAGGNKGENVVVGIIDTGVNAKHKDLAPNYKGGEGSWSDAFKQHNDEPYDGNGHGTHCTGTICGLNGIGVAPAAKFIACRGLDDEGSGDDTTLMACGQFMACPSGNSTGNCTGFPAVVSNSWGGLIGNQDFYNPIISTWRSLNIVPVFALGNSGPICMSAGSPGDQENLISVGATDKNDHLASFSSRGPALITGKMKPEVSAPGKDIVSATHDSNDGYRKLSGTSMACPHVAGAVALILSANPTADFDTVLKTLETTATQPKLNLWDSAKVCSLPKYPNNGYGYGRVSVPAALSALKGNSTIAKV